MIGGECGAVSAHTQVCMVDVSKLSRSQKEEGPEIRIRIPARQQRNTRDYRQFCYVRTRKQHWRLGLFQDTSFAGDLQDSMSTSRGILCFRISNVCSDFIHV